MMTALPALASASPGGVLLAQSADIGPPPGRLVDLGGRMLHLYCTGAGQPTVILEAGASAFAIDWSLVQPELARTNRVCAYDRSGHGWSEPGGARDERVEVDLHTILETAGERPPYELVGIVDVQVDGDFARAPPTTATPTLSPTTSSNGVEQPQRLVRESKSHMGPPRRQNTLAGSRRGNNRSVRSVSRPMTSTNGRNCGRGARVTIRRSRRCYAFCHRPSAAPVGSTMMLNQPICGTSVTSFITFAPSDFALSVAAFTSSTST